MYGAFWCSHCLEQKEVVSSFIVRLPGISFMGLLCSCKFSPSIDVWKRSCKTTELRGMFSGWI